MFKKIKDTLNEILYYATPSLTEVIVTICIGFLLMIFFPMSSKAAPVGPGAGVYTGGVDIIEYMDNLYPDHTGNEKFDKLVFGAVYKFMNSSDEYVKAYDVSGGEAWDFERYFNYNYAYNVDFSVFIDANSGSIYFFPSDDKETLVKNYIETAEKAKKIAATLVGGNDTETARNIYNWIIENVPYDHESGELSYLSVYGAYDGKAVVCKGKASVFDQLCSINGIPCRSVEGKLGDVGHAWNEVYLDGSWYFVDPTNNLFMVEQPSDYLETDDIELIIRQ